MARAFSQSDLRIAGRDPERHDPDAHAAEAARQAVIKANRLAVHVPGLQPGFASDIDATDPRWVLAMQTQSRLQGSVLTPERRDELMHKGQRLGLRRFESNLIMAMVQDRARLNTNCIPAPLLRLAGNMDDCSQDVRFTKERRQRSIASPSPASATHWTRWFLACATAATVTAILIRWILHS